MTMKKNYLEPQCLVILLHPAGPTLQVISGDQEKIGSGEGDGTETELVKGNSLDWDYYMGLSNKTQ